MLSEGRYAAVVSHCRQILAAYPRHVDTYRLLGKAYLSLKKYDDAIDIYQRVLSADPLDVGARVGLATAYRSKKQYPEAIRHIALACELEPYNNSLHSRWQALCREAKQSTPSSAPSQAGLGLLNWRTGLYRPAIQALTPVVQQQPDRVDLQLVLAESYWRLDKEIEAARLCENVLQTLPHSIKANAILAEVWLRTGRVAQARRPLQLLQGLTQPTQTSCDPDGPEGRAFLTKGSIAIPKQLWVAPLDGNNQDDDDSFRGVASDDWDEELGLTGDFYGQDGEQGTADDVEVDFFAMLDAGADGGSLFSFDAADTDDGGSEAWDEDETYAPVSTAAGDDFDIFDLRGPAAPEEEPEDEADVPDWLVEMDTGPLNKGDQQAKAMPDWLSDTAAQEPLLDDDRPDWLADMEAEADEEDDRISSLFMSDAELASLSREQDPFDQPAPPAAVPSAEVDDEFDFWTELEKETETPLAPSAPVQGMDINAFVAANSDTSSLPDWLMDLGDDGGSAVAEPTPPSTPSPPAEMDDDDFSFLDEDEPAEELLPTNEGELAVPDWMHEVNHPNLADTLFNSLTDDPDEEDEADAGFQTDLPDWLDIASPLSPAAADAPQPSAAFWLDEAEESSMAPPDTSDNDLFPLDFLDEKQSSAPAPSTDSPDWLNLFDEGESDEPAAEGELDWLSEAESAVEADGELLADWLMDAAPAETLEEESIGASGFTGWLNTLEDEEDEGEEGEEDTAALWVESVDDLMDWLGSDPTTKASQAVATSADELPDWLGAPPAELETAAPEAQADSPQGLMGWEDAFDMAEDSSTEEELPDWLAIPAETVAEAPAEEEKPQITETGFTGWLNKLEDTGEDDEFVLGATGELMGWLGEADVEDDEEDEEPIDDLMSWLSDVETAEGDGFPDWLGTPAEVVEATAETEIELDTADDLMDWLAEPETAEGDALPDWLGTSAEVVEATAETELELDTAEDLMDWLGETETAEGDASCPIGWARLRTWSKRRPRRKSNWTRPMT
jgi:tetratricopeptide (TPR) repeat protein